MPSLWQVIFRHPFVRSDAAAFGSMEPGSHVCDGRHPNVGTSHAKGAQLPPDPHANPSPQSESCAHAAPHCEPT